MAVLVAVASRHGATLEIAHAIGRTLEKSDIDVVVASVDDVTDVSGYDAVVLGSVVYVGKWLDRARQFVELHAEELVTPPTWLFSSGPIESPPKPSADKAVDVDSILATTRAREHRLFAGKVDASRMSFTERMVTRAVRVEEGDFRDWDAIAEWAESIAEVMRSSPHPDGGFSEARRRPIPDGIQAR